MSYMRSDLVAMRCSLPFMKSLIGGVAMAILLLYGVAGPTDQHTAPPGPPSP